MKAFLCFFIGLYGSFCFGQLDAIETNRSLIDKTNGIDTSYIEDISDKFIVKLNRDSKIDFYTIKTGGFPSVSIAPNTTNNFCFGLDYKFIGFSIGFPKKWY